MGEHGYKKELNFWHVILLTTGAILGPAIAYIPVTVLTFGGPVGIFSWIIAFFLIIPMALVYVELGTMWPKAGGVAYYPAKSHGSLVGLLNGWAAFLGYTLVMPLVVTSIVEYLSFYFPGLYNGQTISNLGIIISVGIVIILFLINIRHVRLMGDINNILTIIKIVLIIFIIAILLKFFDPSNYYSYGGPAPYGIDGLFLAVSATILAYAGFRQPIDYAEEVKDPGKFIPRAVIVSLLIVLLIYMFESIAFLGIINWNKLGLSLGDWSGLSNFPYPFISSSQALGLSYLSIIIIIAVIIASFSDGLIYFGGAARVSNSLSRYDEYFPKFLSKLSDQGIPINSAILVVLISIPYLILLPSFSSVLGVFVDAILVSYAPAAVSLAVFREKFPNENRPFKLPAYKILSPIAFVIGGLLIYWSGFSSIFIAILSVLAGLAFVLILVRKRKFTAVDLKSGLWYLVFIIFTLLFSCIGSEQFGGKNIIPYPYDSLIYAISALFFYYWGLKSVD